MTEHQSGYCASLPVSGGIMQVYYCEHHMAWTAHWTETRQTLEQDMECPNYECLAQGPFDTVADLLDWMQSRLSTFVIRTGGPGY